MLFALDRHENDMDNEMIEIKFHHQFVSKTTVKVQFEPDNSEQALTELCFNCGKLHPDSDCQIPTYYIRCPRCWMVSFDGKGHRPPCAPVNTTSGFHNNILGQLALPMFKFRVRKAEADMVYFNPDKKAFEIMTCMGLFSPPTCGAFSYEKMEEYHLISFKATVYTRFTFLIAIFVNKQWRLRYRAIVSPTHGLLLLKLKTSVKDAEKEDVFSTNYSNTAAVFGLKPKANAMEVGFRVDATDNQSQSQNCNGYTGAINWRCLDGYFDVSSIDDVLDGKTPKTKKMFNRKLYNNFKDLSMAEQVFDFDS